MSSLDIRPGRILLPGKDNKVKFVVVKSKGKEHTHAICHLYPLELSLTHNYNPKGINKRIKAKTTPKNTRNKSSCKQKGKTTKGKANNSLKATQPPSSKLPPRTNRGKLSRFLLSIKKRAPKLYWTIPIVQNSTAFPVSMVFTPCKLLPELSN